MGDEKIRGQWLGPQQQFLLDLACRPLVEAFGWWVFQVGSSLERRDYRDVDVRCMLPDDEFARLFPYSDDPRGGPRLRIFNVAFSMLLSQQSGLPVDFQFQAQTAANEEFGGRPRSALGVWVQPKRVGDGGEGNAHG